MNKLIVALLCIAVIFCSVKTHTLAVMPSGVDISVQDETVEDKKGKKK